MKLYSGRPGPFRSRTYVTLDLTPYGRFSLRSDYRELRKSGITAAHARGVLFRHSIRIGGPNAVLITTGKEPVS